MLNCPVFYRPEMSATTDSFSTSSSKPRRTVEAWLDSGAITQDDIKTFSAVSAEYLYSAHSADYVDGVLRGDLPNGFGNCDADIAKATGAAA